MQYGAEVSGYALPPSELSLFNILDLKKHIKSHIGDINDYSSLLLVMEREKPEIVFHLAAQPLVRRSYKIPSETFEVNVVGTSNIMEALISLPKKCTLVVITTDKVYENNKTFNNNIKKI